MLWLDIYIYINMFIIGTLFGSFFTLASYRIPRKLDIVATRSFCPNCNHKLGFFDLIPVLSYIFHKGKCKYCSKKISIRYFAFEVFNGAIFTLLYAILGLTLNLLLVITLYVAIFLFFSVKYMNIQYLKEKISEIDNENNKVSSGKIKKNLNTKKGVFISELVIAFIMFSLVISVIYATSRNTVNSQVQTIIENNAYLVACNNTEIALATNYDDLYSFNDSEIIDGITYNTSVEVIKYSDMDFSKKDYIKIINTTVLYLVNGIENEYTVSTLKKKVM